MKAGPLGILSALLASVCCLGPVLLVLLGLGSLGFGALIGRYHWWFVGAAMTLLVVAWRSYLKEAARRRAAFCEMARGKTAWTMLILASAVMATFVGLNVYTYASQRRSTPEPRATSMNTALTSVAIPVKGMTCFSCEFTVESSLKDLPGVQYVDANVSEQTVHVSYDAAQIGLDALIAAINQTGFRAELPNEPAQP